MCGIAGLIYLNAAQRGAESHIADFNAAKKMMHSPSLMKRGPDHQAVKEITSRDNILLGFLVSTRLAVTDHCNAAANMPLYSSDERSCIAFNGQIYNFEALRRKLEGSYSFKTQSDTEVILAAYHKWDTQIFDCFEGMYAFCLIDRDKGRAVIAVDHAGQKPLYYYHDQKGQRLIFASDIDTILHSGLVPFELSVPDLQELIVQRYVRDGKTHIKNLNKMVNGTYIDLDLYGNADFEPIRHFHLQIKESQYGTIAKAADYIGDAIINAFNLVVKGSELTPVFLLSSGIDSSTLVAMAASVYPEIKTYTLGFSYGEKQENFYGEATDKFVPENISVSSFLNTLKAKTTPIQKDMYLSASQHQDLIVAWSRDNPHLLYSRDATFLYKIFCGIRGEGARVAISGCGPDEIFDGYNYGNALVAAAQKGQSVARAHYYSTRFLGNIDIQALLGNQEDLLASRVAEKIESFLRYYPPTSPLQAAQIINWHTRSQYECLKSDIASSLNGIEGRKPLYTKELVQAAFQFPAEWKRLNAQEKWIFREAVKKKNLLPAAVANRKKLPFPSPTGLCKMPAWRKTIAEVIHGNYALSSAGAIDWDVVKAYFEENNEEDTISEILFSLALTMEKQKQITHEAKHV